jgi:hypothetical protein
MPSRSASFTRKTQPTSQTSPRGACGQPTRYRRIWSQPDTAQRPLEDTSCLILPRIGNGKQDDFGSTALQNVSTSLIDGVVAVRVSAARFESSKLTTRLMPRFRIVTAYCFFGVTSIKGIAPPVTLGILPFHF